MVSIGKITYIISDISFACASKSLYSKYLTLFHLCRLIPSFHYRYTLCAMNLELIDTVPIQVANSLDLMCLARNLNFITFHSFLNRCSNITHVYIDTSFLQFCQMSCRSGNLPINALTLTPVLVASFTAASKLS